MNCQTGFRLFLNWLLNWRMLFCPGRMTMILPKADHVLDLVTGAHQAWVLESLVMR